MLWTLHQIADSVDKRVFYKRQYGPLHEWIVGASRPRIPGNGMRVEAQGRCGIYILLRSPHSVFCIGHGHTTNNAKAAVSDPIINENMYI